MDFSLTDLNYLAILAAVIINQAIGSLWYSPILFGKIWAEEVGINPSDIDKKAATRGLMIGAFLSIFVYFIVAVIIGLTNTHCWSDGAFIGFILGMLVSFQSAVNFVYEDKSRKLFLINSLFNIISYSIGGTIIGLWL